jgi:hypothetical protein
VLIAELTIPPTLRLEVWEVVVVGCVDDVDLVFVGFDVDFDKDVGLVLESSVLPLSGVSSDCFTEAVVLLSVSVFVESAFILLLEAVTVLEATLRTVDKLDPPWASEVES